MTVSNNVHYDYKLNQLVQKTYSSNDKEGTLYTYDGRGNLVSNDKYTRTTSGMAWQNEETYVYDETNHMVDGKNEKGERSLYTYNGLGLRVGRELIMQDNTHGYTDFHDETPSVETGLNKPEVAVESYVIDYTSPTFRTLTMEEEGGFDYRWVYGLDKLSVKITSEGTNWWGQNVKQDILKDYLHQDRLGNTTNLTDKFGRVVGRADYNEWGEITYKDALDITSAYRRIYPQLNYTGHDWDDVLEMYYAKARFYDPDAKRFVEIDPVKGNVTDPLSLVSYLYCVDNPLRWVDPLGLLNEGNGSNNATTYIVTKDTDWRPTPVPMSSTNPLKKDTVVTDGGLDVTNVAGKELRWVFFKDGKGWVDTQYLKAIPNKNSNSSSKNPKPKPVVTQPATTPALSYQENQNLHPNNPDGTPPIPTNPNDPYIVQKGAVHPNQGTQEPLSCGHRDLEPQWLNLSYIRKSISSAIKGNPVGAAYWGQKSFETLANYRYNQQFEVSGLINGQSLPPLDDFKYGIKDLSWSGCEIIANYNALTILGNPQSLNDVANWGENHGQIADGFFGTWPDSSRQLFEHLGYTVVEEWDSRKFDTVAANSDVSIFTYLWLSDNPNFVGIHTVCVTVNGDGLDIYNDSNYKPEVEHQKSFSDWYNWPGVIPLVLYGIKK